MKLTRYCGNCRFWKEVENEKVGPASDYKVGECVGAIERAREVVPFAIILDVTKTYAHGGAECPCFEAKL